MEALEALETVWAWNETVAAGVRPDQAALTVPSCPAWSIQQLVNHLVAGMNQFVVLLGGGTLGGDGGESPDVGTDYFSVFVATGKANLEAWRVPGALTGTVAFSIGDVPGEVAARFNVQELLLHTWDLAKATDQDATMPTDVVPDALAFAREMLRPEYRSPGTYESELPTITAISEQDQILGFLGRRP